MLSLITLHAAKGLEFSVVFIAGLEESLFPTGRAVEAESGFNPDPRPMEEERRLAYVGMTRARERLYLSHAWQRATRRGPGTSWMAEPSRFLIEIPAELMSGPRLGARPEDGGRHRRARTTSTSCSGGVRRDSGARSGPVPARFERGAGGPALLGPARRSSRRAISRHGARRSPVARARARSVGGRSRPGAMPMTTPGVARASPE